ncbi:hypothetical protein PsorP6_011170 [Peronosclerospora sorghi]|uniref:Uncharacterized protein n=1 Tax=Peronosclerospora sorghi TaxID=230839 RepID=A0ACC0VVB7_9STRA|nr:hypothetical protein PsorP6_011170 [Peronosclerospora sorghi]
MLWLFESDDYPRGLSGFFVLVEIPLLLIATGIFAGSVGLAIDMWSILIARYHQSAGDQGFGLFAAVALLAGSFSVLLTQCLCPQAAGSGPPFMKVAISGINMSTYLSFRCVATKIGRNSIDSSRKSSIRTVIMTQHNASPKTALVQSKKNATRPTSSSKFMHVLALKLLRLSKYIWIQAHFPVAHLLALKNLKVSLVHYSFVVHKILRNNVIIPLKNHRQPQIASKLFQLRKRVVIIKFKKKPNGFIHHLTTELNPI